MLWSLGTGFAAVVAFQTYFGIWLVGELGASAGVAGIGYLLSALVGATGALVGGVFCDRLGPRPTLLLAGGLQAPVAAIPLIPDIGATQAIVAMWAISFLQPVRGVSQRVLLAAVTEPGTREAAFAGASAFAFAGTAVGPLVGAAVVGLGWPVLHGVITAMFVGSALLAVRVAPTSHARTQARLRLHVPRVDGRFALLICAATAAWTVAFGFETLLPILVTSSGVLSPSGWGVLFGLASAGIAVGQLRVSGRLSRQGHGAKTVVGTALMSACFAALLTSMSLPGLVAGTVLFMLGYMVWNPALEAAVSFLAKEQSLGRYMAMSTVAVWVGAGIAPALGLLVWEWAGMTAVWLLLIAVGAVAAWLFGWLAGRLPAG